MKNKQKYRLFNYLLINLSIILGLLTPIKVLGNPISLQRLKLFPEEYTKNNFYTEAWYIKMEKSRGKYVMAISSLDNGTYFPPYFYCQEGVIAFVLSKNLANKLISLNLPQDGDYLVKIYATKLKPINTGDATCNFANSIGEIGYYTDVKKIQFFNKLGKVLVEIKE